MHISKNATIAVIGAGPTGLLTALALAHTGHAVLICGHPRTVQNPAGDGRTAALLTSSIDMLRTLQLWDDIAPACAPLTAIRIVDNLKKLWRAPEVTFRASEVGLPEFGWNVPNDALNKALVDQVLAHPAITPTFGQQAAAFAFEDKIAAVTLDNGEKIAVQAVIGADGQRSPTRQAAAIQTSSIDYGQTAIVSQFSHSRPHRSISTEFHRTGGPLTIVPLPGQTSSVVWVERPDEANRLLSLEDRMFAAELEDQLQGVVGSIHNPAPRRAFPLQGMTAKQFASGRLALVGEAAHAFPPIGAQGLNLSLRDIATLVEKLSHSAVPGRGSDKSMLEALHDYDKARQQDVNLRATGVRMLSLSLTSEFLPMTMARGAVLHAAQSLPMAKRMMMRMGLAPSGHLPPLMRPPSRAH